MTSKRDAQRKTGSAKAPAQRRRPKPPLWVRLLAAALSPVVFLLLAEVVLRVAGYGTSSHFFVPWRHAAEMVYLPNPRFCEHFVPRELSRAPEPGVLRPKDASTIRIFVLGGSAANGDPEPAYGFCRQLEILLNEYSAGPAFEVINAAVTSMNSVVARRIAADCARHQPDLFILYMGNNEVVGPYGPPTLPGWLYASRRFIDASVTVQKDLRLGQLVKNTVQAVRTQGKAPRQWQGMEAFLENEITCDDERLQSCYRHFEANIRDIVATAHRSGAATLLCTVPTNLATCAPFASQHKPGLSETAQRQWEGFFAAGRAAEQQGDFGEALAEYEKAQAIDDAYADLAYCMGKCLLALDRLDEARAALVRAKDLDTLRFRADSRINQIIRAQAAALAQRGAHLLDLEATLERANQDRPLDDAFLVDHVHLNARGNFLMARAAVQAVAQALPQAALVASDRTIEQEYEMCCRRMLYDLAEQYRLALLMYSRKVRPPFAGQLDHDRRLGGLRAGLLELRRALKQTAETETPYREALARAPGDAFLTCRYSRFLLRNQRVSEAIDVGRTYLEGRPYQTDVRIELAKAYALAGQGGRALATLTAKTSPFPMSHQDGLSLIGSFYTEQGRYGEALNAFRRLYEKDARDVQVLVNLASAASHTGDLATARDMLDRAVKIDPGSAPALINMGNYWARQDRTDEAHAWFERAVAADPYNYIPHFNLGQQKLKQGQLRDGLQHVTQSVLLKPDFAQGYQVLAATYAQFDRAETAREYEVLRDVFAP